MPTPEIKKLHKESGEPTKKIDNIWNKLKKEAEHNSKVKNEYAYATGTLEKIFGKKK